MVWYCQTNCFRRYNYYWKSTFEYCDWGGFWKIFNAWSCNWLLTHSSQIYIFNINQIVTNAEQKQSKVQNSTYTQSRGLKTVYYRNHVSELFFVNWTGCNEDNIETINRVRLSQLQLEVNVRNYLISMSEICLMSSIVLLINRISTVRRQ